VTKTCDGVNESEREHVRVSVCERETVSVCG
jgi:hypothetical protein